MLYNWYSIGSMEKEHRIVDLFEKLQPLVVQYPVSYDNNPTGKIFLMG